MSFYIVCAVVCKAVSVTLVCFFFYSGVANARLEARFVSPPPAHLHLIIVLQSILTSVTQINNELRATAFRNCSPLSLPSSISNICTSIFRNIYFINCLFCNYCCRRVCVQVNGDLNEYTAHAALISRYISSHGRLSYRGVYFSYNDSPYLSLFYI